MLILHKIFLLKIVASYKLNITNSNEVLLLENAFEKTNIRGQFLAIKDLRINEKAFKSAQARVSLTNLYNFNL